MPLDTNVGLGPGHIVLDGDPAPPKGAQPPIFGPCLLWIKMPLGTELGLGPDDAVLDRGPSSMLPLKGGTAPTFPPMPILAKLLDGSRCHLVRR